MLSRQLLGWTAAAAGIASAMCAVVLAAFREIPLAMGTFVGYAIGIGSLSALWWCISRVVGSNRGRCAVRGLVVLNLVRYAIMCAAIWTSLRFGAEGIGLGVGVVIVYAALTAAGIIQARRMRKQEGS